MTSERILSNKYRHIPRESVFRDDKSFDSLRSSNKHFNLEKRVRKQYGFAEPTATIVWSTLNELNLNPFEVILWNIFPFHPFNSNQGALSNRPIDDITTGIPFVEKLIYMNPQAKIIAIGQPSHVALTYHYIPCSHVPHPAHGHTPEFKEKLREIVENNSI